MESADRFCIAGEESAAARPPGTSLYARLAADIAASIRAGAWENGNRIPSVRQCSRDRGVSAATVIRALELLEEQGYIESVPRSGHYVSDSWREKLGATQTLAPVDPVTPLDVSEIVFQLVDSIRDQKVVQFGSPFPSPELFPFAGLGHALGSSVQRMHPWRAVKYIADGSLELRQRISQRYMRHGANVTPDEIVVTSGALEGLNLCLQVVTRPGDTVAIESPTFYGCLHAIENLGLQALEISTHPRDGVDLAVLAKALATGKVRACWFMTTYQNPLGTCMLAPAKRELVRLIETYGVPLIEDSVYTELYHSAKPPKWTKAFDRRGMVLECGSFSKCLSPGYRVGWVAAGRYAQAVRRRKLVSSLETNVSAQDAIASFIRTGAYDRHLRGLRRTLASQQAAALKSLDRHFPAGFRVVKPEGGYFLWIELPGLCSAIDLYRIALSRGISIAPGPIFSHRREFDRFMRLNYGHPWTAASDAAVAALADIIRSLMRKTAA